MSTLWRRLRTSPKLGELASDASAAAQAFLATKDSEAAAHWLAVAVSVQLGKPLLTGPDRLIAMTWRAEPTGTVVLAASIWRRSLPAAVA